MSVHSGNIKRITTHQLKEMKSRGEKIAMLTAYDYPSARLLDESGVDGILVGDSCAMVLMGRENTLNFTMDEAIHHVKMVARGATRALVIADMPFLSYQINVEETIRNAGRFVVEGGAQAVKLEGPVQRIGDHIAAIRRAGIPVMGHVGLTPQSLLELGGYKVQGRETLEGERIAREAETLQEAGCFAVVLECIPPDLAVGRAAFHEVDCAVVVRVCS